MVDFTAFNKFISGTGAAEVLIKTEELEPVKTKTLNKEIQAAGKTVTDRINKAHELGLIEVSDRRPPGEHGNARFYQMTGEGRRILRAIESTGLLQTLQKLREVEQRKEEQLKTITRWEAEFQKESGLDETKYNLKTLVELGFPGDHDYSNPLAFYFQDESVDPDDTNWFLHEDSNEQYDLFDRPNED